MFKDYYDLHKVGVLSTRIEDMYLTLADEICHGSSEKEWRNASPKDYLWHRMRNPTLP